MAKKFVLIFSLVILPLGFFFYFVNKDVPKMRLKRYIPVPENVNQANSVKVNDTTWHTVPPFEFMGHTGKKITDELYKGKIYVTDFFFTHCPGICPMMSKQMARVQKEFRNDENLLFLSHTVDPERDDVATLAKYAEVYEVDSSRWSLVTGDKKDLYHQARKGYFVTAKEGDGGEEDFVHTEKFVLVDKQGVIRGYYDGTDSVAVNKLMSDVLVLMMEYGEQKAR